ncbi:ROK family protein [Phosphitispora fastidiosa]|uniref:ROK family protein n=1 Tax=Phosphitispora fastidiosa TaxID=2837202 RepID=UPI001E52C397|nr:ROK family protein [Phosphitispora fastidiosa]MBU7006267.1 glucokinase [Phosphitispora fastidiosa]
MNDKFVIGIDLGGTNIKGALLDLDGGIIEKREIPTLANAGPEAVAGRIAGMITELEAAVRDTGKSVAGVGIGVPGQPERSTGEVIFAPNLYWRNVPLVKYLRRYTGLPVFLENDANVAALGEQWRGAGQGSANMVMVTIGTGIGGGIVLDGRLYTGSNGAAGELGHAVIEPAGPQCSCGRRGCLETLTSATAMVRMAREALDRGVKTELSKEENLEARDIIMAAQAGDRLALDIVEKAAYYLGIGLGNIINILNPDTIVIGGGVSRAGELLFEPLCRNARANCLDCAGSIVRIVPAQLGNDAGFVGAAKLVLQDNTKKCII